MFIVKNTSNDCHLLQKTLLFLEVINSVDFRGVAS